MKPLFRSTLLTTAALAIMAAGPSFAAKDVVFAVASTFTTTDPYDANDTLSQAMAKSFYQGLYGFDKDMKMIPVLAESHEVTKDGLVYTFKLRKGVKFHDGTEFKADAVKANFDRVTNPDNKLKRYSLYNNIAKTEVVDDYTARVTLKTPFSAFVNQIAHPSGVMISPTALQKYGKDIAFNPVGTGPFKFVEWKQTDYLKVAKFDGYWKKGLPKVDTITWKPVIDNNSRSAVMQTGEAHFTFPVPYEQVDTLKAKADLEVVAAPSIVHRYMSMNMLQKPFDNPKVRQAINYAINKEALAKVAFNGYAFPAEGATPGGVEYHVNLDLLRQCFHGCGQTKSLDDTCEEGATLQQIPVGVHEPLGVHVIDILDRPTRRLGDPNRSRGGEHRLLEITAKNSYTNRCQSGHQDNPLTTPQDSEVLARLHHRLQAKFTNCCRV